MGYIILLYYIGRIQNKGKENQDVSDRKRAYKEDEIDEEDKEKLIKPKKRRLIIPNVDSDEDSGDDYKPSLYIL